MSRRRTDPIDPSPSRDRSRARPDGTRLDDVAGLRVMRRFAAGTRATLLLAHPPSRDAQGDTAPRLVKVFHSHTSATSIDVELAALSTGAPHVVQLLDVASVEPGEPPCLVLEKLPGPSLASYFEQSPAPSAGQAVTILAPLCAGLQALHDAGVTHGAIHVRRIVLDDRGAPVLTGLGRGRLREPPDVRNAAAWPYGPDRAAAPEEFREESWRDAVLGDQRDLLVIVEEVLGRVHSGRSPASLDIALLSRDIGVGPSRSFLARLEAVLFEFASPEVVSPTGARQQTELSAPAITLSRTLDGGADIMSPADYDWSSTAPLSRSEPAENRVIGALRILGASSSALEMASSVIDAAVRLAGRRPSQAQASSPELEIRHKTQSRRNGRRPLLVGASCAVLATAGLLLALPAQGDEARAGGADPTTSHRPSAEVAPEDPALPAPTDESPSLLGDDPVEALRALSRVNESCAGEVEVEACRQHVFPRDYQESASVADAPIVIDATDALATGRWGGSALVAALVNGQPASFLLVKGEAGWRVRDVFLSDQ